MRTLYCIYVVFFSLDICSIEIRDHDKTVGQVFYRKCFAWMADTGSTSQGKCREWARLGAWAPSTDSNGHRQYVKLNIFYGGVWMCLSAQLTCHKKKFTRKFNNDPFDLNFFYTKELIISSNQSLCIFIRQ